METLVLERATEVLRTLRVAKPLRVLSVDEQIEALLRGQARVERGLLVPSIRGGATQPAFAATPNVGSGLVPSTLDTSLTAPSNVTTVFTPGASGSKVDEIRFQGVGSTVAGVINVFRYDGSTYWLIDQVLLTVVTSSTTAVAFQAVRTYENLLLKSTDTIRVSVTVAGDQSLVAVTALGGDF